MANETLSTTISAAISTYIRPQIMNYAKKKVVALPHVLVEELGTAMGKPAKTAQFVLPTKDASGSLTEGTDASNTQLDFTSVTATAAEVGIVRDVSKLARRVNVLGDVGLMNWIIRDGGQLCFEKIETDIWALFASASTSVGTTATAFTLANFAQGLSQLTLNDAIGDASFFATPAQTKDLREALMTSAAAILGSGLGSGVLSREQANGFVGSIMNTPIWTSSAAATSGSDKIGAFMVNGASNPEEAAIGMALVWWPEPDELPNPSLRSQEIAVTTAYAVVEVIDRSYTQVVTSST